MQGDYSAEAPLSACRDWNYCKQEAQRSASAGSLSTGQPPVHHPHPPCRQAGKQGRLPLHVTPHRSAAQSGGAILLPPRSPDFDAQLHQDPGRCWCRWRRRALPQRGTEGPVPPLVEAPPAPALDARPGQAGAPPHASPAPLHPRGAPPNSSTLVAPALAAALQRPAPAPDQTQISPVFVFLTPVGPALRFLNLALRLRSRPCRRTSSLAQQPSSLSRPLLVSGDSQPSRFLPARVRLLILVTPPDAVRSASSRLASLCLALPLPASLLPPRQPLHRGSPVPRFVSPRGPRQATQTNKHPAADQRRPRPPAAANLRGAWTAPPSSPAGPPP